MKRSGVASNKLAFSTTCARKRSNDLKDICKGLKSHKGGVERTRASVRIDAGDDVCQTET